MDIVLIAFIGYVLGAIGRTTYDYLIKKLANEELTFDNTFIATMLISIILTLITATFTFPSTQVFGTEPFKVMFAAGAQGFAINHVLNGLVTYQMKKRTEAAASADS
jgi:magnesium-transporting ATPase (P-type)